DEKEKFLYYLMEGKIILLCLMVIVQLGIGNSIHVDDCEGVIAFTAAECSALDCRRSCRNSWAEHVYRSYCRVGQTQQYCYCFVCDEK
uniref:Knottin scorpion toxin-like domain-containing protein n=1 Tax=Aegilops tauschii subsp. strangulata TaxID=200361 RepID=A0A453GWZ4_AEGTS